MPFEHYLLCSTCMPANQTATACAKQMLFANACRYAPIVADAEAGFGGPLNCFELMKQMIEAGAAGVHFEDQLSSEKKCGHLGGKVSKDHVFPVCCSPLGMSPQQGHIAQSQLPQSLSS